MRKFPFDRIDSDDVKPLLNWVLHEAISQYEGIEDSTLRLRWLSEIRETLTVMYPPAKWQKHNAHGPRYDPLATPLLDLPDDTREELARLEEESGRRDKRE